MAADDVGNSSVDGTQPVGAADVPIFSVQFIVETGVPCGGGLYEWTSVLNVSGGKSPRCSMLLTRHNGDLIGRPVGMFSDALPTARAKQMAARLDAAASAELPRPKKGDINASTLRLKYQHGTIKLSADFNAQNRTVMAAIAPVMEDLRGLMSQLLGKPESAVVVSLEKKAETAEGVRFALTLTNSGTREVTVGDPRIVPLRGVQERAFVQVAPKSVRVPGEMEIPPEWETVRLEPAPGELSDVGTVIAPNGSLTVLSMAWTPPSSGEYLVQGVWQDCNGPVKIDPLKFQPIIPTTAGPDSRPFLLRGAAFSTYTRFTIAKK